MHSDTVQQIYYSNYLNSNLIGNVIRGSLTKTREKMEESGLECFEGKSSIVKRTFLASNKYRAPNQPRISFEVHKQFWTQMEQ